MKHKFSHYLCSVCGAEYGTEEVTYTCPADGGNLSVILDYAAINAWYTAQKFMDLPEASLWRYLSLLPVADPGGIGTPLRRAGWTPVYQTTRLAEKLGLKSLWIKDEAPTRPHHLKTEPAPLWSLAQQKVALRLPWLPQLAMPAQPWQVWLPQWAKAVIFAPRTAPPAKIAQLIIFGAKVLLVDGNYDQAFDLSIEATHAFGWYNRNTGFNPFTTEGKKTAGFEIWEQVIRRMPAESKPLTVFIPVGDGNIISGVHKGFKDLQALGC